VARASIPLSGLKARTRWPPYVRLIHDVLLGDRSLFTRPDGLAAVWDVAAPLLAHPPKVVSYPQGSWGPGRGPRAHRPAAGCWASNRVRVSGRRSSLRSVRPGWRSVRAQLTLCLASPGEVVSQTPGGRFGPGGRRSPVPGTNPRG